MVIYWSPTRIDYANYCKMRYWLRYVDKKDALRLSAYVKGGLLHTSIEKFWNKLGTEEQAAKKSSRKKYSNRDEFSKYVRGKWMSLVIGSKNAEFPIMWSYESEPYVVEKQLDGICKGLYDYLSEVGRPLFAEMPFEFSLLGERFRGRIDEIRREDSKVFVRDFKSGNPWVGPMKEKYDLQLTLYNAAICSLARCDADFARKLGLEDKRHMYMGNPMYVDPDIGVEFFMIEALGTNKKVIHQSSRTDGHFLELVRMIDGINITLNQGVVYPERGRKCDPCDMRHVCGGLIKRTREDAAFDEKGQGSLDFAVPLYRKPSQGETIEEIKKASQGQIKMSLRRDLKGYEREKADEERRRLRQEYGIRWKSLLDNSILEY
ncbi:MAG TPA: PD-(D/E)XK nuclease family protein [Candidatus Nanoarchaeia archaeon]|nr:PD-(D/E)XK nuclease family protein [Candidatus Nanoarchaeia archaeon]